MTLVNQFIQEYGSSAPEQFAGGLMKGDPEQFKAGYSPDNAAIATVEAFQREGVELDSGRRVRQLCESIGADADLVARILARS